MSSSFFGSFFQSKADRKAIELLEHPEQYGSYTLHSLLRLLSKTNSKELQTKLAAKLHDLVCESIEKLPSNPAWERRYFDLTMKEYDICRKRMPLEYLSSLLILASVENSGYIREKAIREWATHLDPTAVRFLVDRLSDWVPQVRRAAWDSLQQYMKPEYFSCFLKRFYWIDRLLGKENPNSFRYGEELVAFVMAHDFTEEIGRHLNESDYRNWKSYVEHSLNGQIKTNPLLFETVRKDPSPTIRSAVIRILDDLPETKRDELLEEALWDRAQPSRSRAFYHIVKHLDRPSYERLVYIAASDYSPSLREAARFYLKDQNVDWHRYYKFRINMRSDVYQNFLGGYGKRQMLGNLGGFGEFATENDIPFLERFLQIPDGKTQALALETIYRLSPIQGIELAKKLLVNHIGYLGRSCVQILGQKSLPETFVFARELAQSESIPHRILSLKLLNKIGGWNIAGDLLRASVDPDKDVRRIAKDLLDDWIHRFSSQGWIKPGEEDVKHVVEAVEYARSNNLPLPATPLKKVLFFFGIRNQ